MTTEHNDKQLRHLSQSIRLREETSPRLVRVTMTAVSLSILAFLAWAAVAEVPEIAHTPGEIVPTGFQQVVQHLEGGIVKEILAQEGDAVEKDQILLRLDGAGAVEDLKRAQDQRILLGLQEERLRAFIEDRAPKFSEEALARKDLIKDQESFYTTMTTAKEKEKDIIGEQIAQKKQMIGALAAELETARNNHRITGELFSRRQEMNRRGVLSDMKLLETEQQYNILGGQVKSISGQIAAAKSAIAEYQNRLSSLGADNMDEANQQLDGILAASTQNREVIEKLKNRVARLDIRSPVHGTVKGLSVNTIGSVVQPGQVIMEIVPTDAPLIVSLRIPPRFIGHLKEGQQVQVKSSSFDFSRYGAVGGTLDFISAATFEGNNGERYYQGRVRLDRNYIGEDKNNAVLPGMTVMADIVTGEKTVLQYLLKPIRNAIDTAFTER